MANEENISDFKRMARVLELDKLFDHARSSTNDELKALSSDLEFRIFSLQQLDPRGEDLHKAMTDFQIMKREYWRTVNSENEKIEKKSWEKKTFYINTCIKVLLAFLTYSGAKEVAPKIAKEYYQAKPLIEKIKYQDDQIQRFMNLLIEDGKVMSDEDGKPISFPNQKEED